MATVTNVYILKHLKMVYIIFLKSQFGCLNLFALFVVKL